MTLRVPGDLRKVLRRMAEHETDERGQVVSVHDVLLGLVVAEARARGAKV
jgi:hypothetical protein